MSEIAIIGAGAWGTALSIVLGAKRSTEFGSGRMNRKFAKPFYERA